MQDLIGPLFGELFLAIFLFYPVRKTFARAGLNPNDVFWFFLPLFGMMIVVGILAFSDWPATQGNREKLK
jgi:hypothetical protein